jgi:YihY family inner membrane protein
MQQQTHQYRKIIQHPFRFLAQVATGFRANQGLLLSGAVAYYALLSIVPLIILILLALSHVVDEQLLLQTLQEHIEVVVPAHADVVVNQIALFLEHRHVVSWILITVLLFFSSMAFTVLENAMSFIFHHRVSIKRRHFMLSAILPYIYIVALGLGFLIMTLISAALDTLGSHDLVLLGYHWPLIGASKLLLYLIGLGGQVLILSSFYLVMPARKLSLRHALVGGITAAILWEGTRHLLVWYFSSLSFVGVVYGSLATTIVALLSLEAAAMILLLGAQVIAEYERFGLDVAEEDGNIHT